jgi:hypothetical protein
MKKNNILFIIYSENVRKGNRKNTKFPKAQKHSIKILIFNDIQHKVAQLGSFKDSEGNKIQN